ncbi:MAG: hypothetical protein WCS89_03510 [Candidatus Paceibacterota bacterium]
MKTENIKCLLVHRGTRNIPKFKEFVGRILRYTHGHTVSIICTYPAEFLSESICLASELETPESSIHRILVSENQCGEILQLIKNIADDADVVIVIGDEKLATFFPLYFLQNAVPNSQPDPNILNVVEEGETVVVDTEAGTRDTLVSRDRAPFELYD